MTYAKLMKAAEDNWPEDEAFAAAEFLFGGDEPEDAELTARHVAHMHAVFNRHSDGAELIARFDSELAKLRASYSSKGE